MPQQSNTTPASRPQTLRQAKAAYRRTSGTSRLSERELAQIRRRAELEARAARIKERERKKAVDRRKREALKAKSAKAAVKVDEGQGVLGRYFRDVDVKGGGAKTIGDHDHVKMKENERSEGGVKEEEEEKVKSPTRTVLGTIHANILPSRSSPSSSLKRNGMKQVYAPSSQPPARPLLKAIDPILEEEADLPSNSQVERELFSAPTSCLPGSPSLPVSPSLSQSSPSRSPQQPLLPPQSPPPSAQKEQDHKQPSPSPPQQVPAQPAPQQQNETFLQEISTQDFELTAQDLEEISGCCPIRTSHPQHAIDKTQTSPGHDTTNMINGSSSFDYGFDGFDEGDYDDFSI